ncbi:MAG: hypothetical protein WA632_06455 [Gallionella sp.]
MSSARRLLAGAMLILLFWAGSGNAEVTKPSSGVTGTWYSERGTKLTFRSNGTITYHGKRYYFAVTNGGIIQLKGRRGEVTIPYSLAGGQLTLTEDGEKSVYKRKR